jgi:hypothetical protein
MVDPAVFESCRERMLLRDLPRTAEGRMLVQWFDAIDQSRGYGGLGFPEPLRYSEIEAWARLHRIRLTPWNVRMLKLIDSFYLKEQAEKLTPEKK